MKKNFAPNIDGYIEMKNEINYQKKLNYAQAEAIKVLLEYIDNQEKIAAIYVNRLKEYAKMLEKREVDMHDILDHLIVKDKLQLMQHFIGEIPNRVN